MRKVKIMLMMYCCSSIDCGHTFVRTDERTEGVLGQCPKCGNKTFFKCDFRTWTGSLDNDSEDFIESVDELSDTLKLLSVGASEEGLNLKSWKNRMVLYHDELWKILVGNEPEKYRRNCPTYLL